ncbi:MAG TPA: 5-oxoprolinase subunit PxpA [Bryobacteraceae bacterium]|jgi:UPF0271 protein
MQSGKTIDVNCDMGEIPALIADGTQDLLLAHVTSVNVSCGAHAGDEETIERTIRAAVERRVHVGAHPGYPDRENFGRVALAMSPAQIADSVFEQLVSFEEIASRCGAVVRHVKPHGALYNTAVKEHATAQAIADGIRRWRKSIPVMGLAGSLMLDVFRAAGLEALAEAFADRTYEPDGTLRSRQLPGAMIHSAVEASEQALRLAQSGTVDTICIHSDTRGSVEIAAAVEKTLREAGFIGRN